MPIVGIIWVVILSIPFYPSLTASMITISIQVYLVIFKCIHILVVVVVVVVVVLKFY